MKELGKYDKLCVYENTQEMVDSIIDKLKIKNKEDFFNKVRVKIKERHEAKNIIFFTTFPNGLEVSTGGTFSSYDLSDNIKFMHRCMNIKTTYKSSGRNNDPSNALGYLAHECGLLEILYPVLRTDWEDRLKRHPIVYDSDRRHIIDTYSVYEVVSLMIKKLTG